ncbi:SIMPL domain-containing protein [Noviherbaspirillum massiliense]|uniref:SIMPL domain-containing protein n=1 Tax=Noviherbaspirillum massiliense TaxID=1465823 RepID=UPI000302E751|nr:SIMPL domain-containing protein [Noviherbaspirillum massiliense]
MLVLAAAGWNACAQAPVQTAGTLVIVPAYAEVKYPNDEAHVTFMIEEQDKDKSVAASRVNQKMKEGIDIIRREDPQATLRTRGYYTYPVYPDDQPRVSNRPRQPSAWRVGHYLEMTTTNLTGLSRTAASAQRVLALNGLYFSLTEPTSRKLDAKRIEAAYANLGERVAAIAKAMGRNPSDAVLEMVDLEASGAYAPQQDIQAPKAMRSAAMEAAPVEEPSFEPGEATLGMRIVGKLRFR